MREKGTDTPRRYFSRGHASQFEDFGACNGILKPSRNNRCLNPNDPTFDAKISALKRNVRVVTYEELQ